MCKYGHTENSYVNGRGENVCRDCQNERAHRYYVSHSEIVNAKAREAYLADPTPKYLNRDRYRARKLNAFVEDVKRTTVYEMHGGMCGICEQFIDGAFHVDHIMPLSKGGLHSYANTQPAHPTCNLRKGVKL